MPLSGVATEGGLVGLRARPPRPGDTQIRCGMCVGCQVHKAVGWSVRIWHESQMHANNYFVTLTYNEESLPRVTPEGHSTVLVDDLQRFCKRLERKTGPFRRYGVGEYGTKKISSTGGPGHRAHYHLALFGLDADLQLSARTFRRNRQVFDSAVIRKAWTEAGQENGRVEVEPLTAGQCAYLGGYVTKKLGKRKADPSYVVRGGDPGCTIPGKERPPRPTIRKNPEFSVQSRGGRKQGAAGIGSSWLKKHFWDVYGPDCVYFRGKKFPPPKYYDDLAAQWEGEEFIERVKEKRKARFGHTELMTYEEWRSLQAAEQSRIYENGKRVREPE